MELWGNGVMNSLAQHSNPPIPPFHTINRGDTFVLAEPDSSIHPGTDQGIYTRDTRYVSSYDVFADGKHWVLQNSGALIVDRAVSHGAHEDFDIPSYTIILPR